MIRANRSVVMSAAGDFDAGDGDLDASVGGSINSQVRHINCCRPRLRGGKLCVSSMQENA